MNAMHAGLALPAPTGQGACQPIAFQPAPLPGPPGGPSLPAGANTKPVALSGRVGQGVARGSDSRRDLEPEQAGTRRPLVSPPPALSLKFSSIFSPVARLYYR